VKTLAFCVAALAALAVMSTAAMAAQPGNPVPGPPVAYTCDLTGKLAVWDDQFYPFDDPLCDSASENFFLCLAKYGQFRIETPSVAEFEGEIINMYIAAGAGVAPGKCLPQERTYWLCYGAGANSLRTAGPADAVKSLAAGQRVPHASKTIKTSTKVGSYYLTCDDQGQKPTGRVVSTGNGGEVVSGPASAGTSLLRTNPLDYTVEVE
jgi:hypothetical protein